MLTSVDRRFAAHRRRQSGNKRFGLLGAFRADRLRCDAKGLIVRLCSFTTSPRGEPIDCRFKTISCRIDAAPGHGAAVLWGVNVRISAIAPQNVQPRDVGLKTSRRIDGSSSNDILSFVVLRAKPALRNRLPRPFRLPGPCIQRLQTSTVGHRLGHEPPISEAMEPSPDQPHNC
jgi:hypothetical protein